MIMLITNPICKLSLIRFLVAGMIILSLSNCSVSRSSYHPGKKYSPEDLQKDYSVFRGALEESHPSVYWYTPKKEMDAYFDWGAARLNDSLNEEDFRRVLTYVIAKVNCGHTVVRNSKQFLRFRDSTRLKFFPLSLKLWPDTTVVTSNLNAKDSILRRGTIINRINGVPVNTLLDTFFKYVSSDGYNYTHKYQMMSNRGNFGTIYTALYGLRNNYLIDFIDSMGKQKSIRVPAYDLRSDTAGRPELPRIKPTPPSERRRKFRDLTRSFRIDSTGTTAVMELGSFGKALRLRSFFKRSFKKLRRDGIQNLVIDVRGNGGGSVTNSTLLTKYIADKKFRVSDSLYANTRNSRYKKHIKGYFFNRLFMVIMTKKWSDGKYHFGYFERHYFTPKKKNRFSGKVFVITGGNSFSATTLFAQTVKEQPNVLIVGEETGGGAYGNSAWLIPDAVLPITKLRFRLPLFRLVINKELPKNGRGVLPEVEAFPTVDAIRHGIDFKMNKAFELIKQSQQY